MFVKRSFDRWIQQDFHRRMLRISKTLKHQAKSDVPEERGNFRRSIGISFSRHNVTSRSLWQSRSIIVNQDDGDSRLAELRKNL